MADITNPDESVMTHNADVYWHYAGDPVQRSQLLGTFTIGTAQKVLLPIPTDADIVLRAVPRGGRGQTFMGSPGDATPHTVSALGVGSGGGTSNFYQQLKVNHGYSYGTVPTPRPVLNLLQSFQIKDDAVFGESDLTTFGVPTGQLNLKTDFNASGQIAVTTATWSGTGSDIVLPVTLELQPGQGIYVAGAGVSGSPLVTTCLAVSADGKTITLNAGPFTAGPYTIVQADDTAAVQAWLNAKGDLAMPPGYYRLSSSITLPTTSEGFSIIIHGSGWDQSQFVFQNHGDGFVPTSDLKIDSLVFLDLTVATGTIGDASGTIDALSKGIGIRMTAPGYTGIYNNFVMQRCRVIGWGRFGLWSDNMEVSWISQCIFRENKSGHVAFVGPDTISPNKQPNANTITDSTFDQAISAGPSDSKRTVTGSMTAGSRTLSGSGFSANDRGKFVIVHGAATGGGDLYSFVDVFNSSSNVTLAHQAQFTASGTLEVFPVNVASILLNRANDTVLDGSTIQGNFADAGSGATNTLSDVNAIKCYNSANCRFIGIHEEDNAGPGGAAIRMENCIAMTIENWGGTSAGPPDFINAHSADFDLRSCHCVSVKNSFFNDRPQFVIDSTSSEIQIDDSFIVGDINLWQQDNSWDRLRVGSGVRVYQAADPRTNRVAGNEYSYDSMFGRDLIVNGRFLDGSAGMEGWTGVNPTWWALTTNSQTRGGTFVHVNATTQSPSTFATKILSQLVPIPDTTGPGLFTLAFDWNIDSQEGVETTGYYVEVCLHPSSGIDEVLQFSTRRFAVVQDTWQVGHIRCFLGSGTGRTIEVQVNVTPGPNNVIISFANFRMCSGKHMFGAWERGIHDFGGRMHAPIEYASLATTGTGSISPPPIGATYMSMVNDAGTLKIGYNGVWSTVASGGGSGAVISGTPNQFAMFNSPSGNNVVNAPVEFAFGQVHFKLVGAWLDRTLPLVSVYGTGNTAHLIMVDTDDTVYVGPKFDTAGTSTGALVLIRSGSGTQARGRLWVDGANGKLTFNDTFSNSYNSAVFVRIPLNSMNGITLATQAGTYTGQFFLQCMSTTLDVVQFAVDSGGDITRIKHRSYTWPIDTPVNTGAVYNVLGYVGQTTANQPVTLVWTPMTGGSGGHVIQDEGGPLPAQGALNFTGAGVTASNNTTFPRTDVTIWTATTLQEGTVSISDQHFAGRKFFDSGSTVSLASGGSAVALVVQSTGGSVGAHIQDWWSGGGTAIAYIDTQPVLRLGSPGLFDGFLELCSAVASSQTVKLACGIGATAAQVLYMPKTFPSVGQVLQVQTAGGANVQLQWGTGGSGSGYSQIQEEGTPVAVRSNLNFIGSGFTAADDSANNRTNVTLFAASVTQDGIVNNLAQTFTGRKTFNVGATMQSIASIEPVLTCKLIAGGGTSARVQEWQNSSATVLAYLDATPKFSMACDVLPDVDYPTTARHLGNSAFRWVEVGTGQITWNSSNVRDIISTATPVGSIAAPVGTVCRNVNGTTGQTLFVKETGTGTSGWTAVGAGGGGGAGTGTNNTLARWTTTSGILADSGIVDNVASGPGSAGSGIVFNRDFVYGRGDGTINFGDTTTRIGGVYIKNALWMWTGANVGNSPSSPTTMGFLSGGASTYSRILVSGNENYIQGSPQGGRLTIGGYHAIELRGSRRNASAGSVSTTAGDGYGVLVWQEGSVNTIVPLVIGSQLALIGDLTNWQNNGVEQAALNAAGTLRMGGLQGRIVRLNPGAGVTVDMATQFGLMDCRTIVCDLASGSFKIRLPFLSTCNGRSWHIVLRPKSVISSAFFVSLMVQSGDDINEVAMTTTSEWQLNINSNLQRYVVLTADYNAGSSPQWRLAGFNSP
jgi:hypothetical protein